MVAQFFDLLQKRVLVHSCVSRCTTHRVNWPHVYSHFCLPEAPKGRTEHTVT